jgi:hypothetical protein
LEQLILPLRHLIAVEVELPRKPGHRSPALDRGREDAKEFSRIKPSSFHGQSTLFLALCPGTGIREPLAQNNIKVLKGSERATRC